MMMQWHVTRDVVYEAVVRDGALPKVNGLNNVALTRISAMVSVGPDESVYISPFLYGWPVFLGVNDVSCQWRLEMPVH